MLHWNIGFFKKMCMRPLKNLRHVPLNVDYSGQDTCGSAAENIDDEHDHVLLSVSHISRGV